MSALNPAPYRPGDRVATVGADGRGGRMWVLGTVCDAGAHAALVTVRWDDNVVGLFGVLDANLRHLDDVPVEERHWLPEAQRERLLRGIAARRLVAALDVWPHSDAAQRATVAALAHDLTDASFECIGCDAAARALLGVPLVDADRLRGGTG